jgi:hypothetical protein
MKEYNAAGTGSEAGNTGSSENMSLKKNALGANI